jgi:hypothetical protein
VRLLGTASSAAAHKVKGSSAYVLMYVQRSFTANHWPTPTENYYHDRLSPGLSDVATETNDSVMVDAGVV